MCSGQNIDSSDIISSDSDKISVALGSDTGDSWFCERSQSQESLLCEPMSMKCGQICRDKVDEWLSRAEALRWGGESDYQWARYTVIINVLKW